MFLALSSLASRKSMLAFFIRVSHLTRMRLIKGHSSYSGFSTSRQDARLTIGEAAYGGDVTTPIEISLLLLLGIITTSSIDISVTNLIIWFIARPGLFSLGYTFLNIPVSFSFTCKASAALFKSSRLLK